ncbi:PfkB family carbohydrate kinase [Phytohabitans sp. ZYX-F-186]|uniref:PfkB family carbohydrate kinase n=1 Tax=Phytohabitans maris TaxID=3071409 RepID=A0ABU0ZH01_9ACTN|nr:PfkB family carbohydrate kinase [Phytohabitans sp. ZYX-F-186]MDQ7906334.1 PfkB family carbohydrate kinase [Phytohabitans sp. ZYX-F-186]
MSLAPSLDRYAWLPALRLGGINRPRDVLVRAGGKGLNAARAATSLGVPTRAVALVGGATGEVMRAHTDGLDVSWVDSGVETRECQCLLDEGTGTLTQVYEPVRAVPAALWPGVRAAVVEHVERLGPGDAVALSGRVPPGLPVTALAEIVDVAAARGVPVLVDSDGPALAAALARRPDLVKVNEHEAAAVTGAPAQGWASAEALRALGARAAVVTAGPGGARYLGPDGRRAVTHPPLDGALPVGSGDAFLAGLAAAHLADGGADVLAGLRLAAAAARANARHLPAGDFTRAEVEAELPALSDGSGP